ILLIGITLVAFVVTHLVPGDPVAANLGQSALGDPAAVAAFRHQYGLDQPLPVQYLRYLGDVLTGNLGISEQSHRAVLSDLEEYVPATVELALFAIVTSLVIGVGLGIVAAAFRDRWPDQVIRVVSLGWLPGGGRLDPPQSAPVHLTGLYTVDALVHGQWELLWSSLRHLILPGLVLAVYTIGMLTRFTRASMLEIMGNDYVRAARLKGLPERTVILRHVLRPALISVITVAGLAFADLLSGTVLVENIFAWPGIGQYAYHSTVNLDLPAIMGVSLFIALVYIVLNLVVDLLYGVIDPRIRLS